MKLVTSILLSLFCSIIALCQHAPPIKREGIVGEFKYSNLKEFQIDSIFWSEDTLKNTPIPYHRYSSQKNSRGFEEFTVIEHFEDEIMCGKRIQYVIYDSKQKLLSQFIVSDDSKECYSNEEGYYSKAYGKFLDESTYEIYWKWIEKGKNSISTTFSVARIKITLDGKLIEKEVSRKTVTTPIERWKFIPLKNDTLPKRFEYITEDGHRVRNNNALLVDNWLYHHNVEHAFEKQIPDTGLKTDFYLKEHDCYIVVFSERNNDGLEDKMKLVNYFLKVRLKFAEVFLNDIENLDKKMREKFAKNGITLKAN